ncbi:uncharacterized protein LOC126808653 [Patella vulgata]|uniref:uncharacterized protein LOC126808653 n=1 Tax=Patella vulgata TaxID=6465 RepID=UPI00217FE69B|nr:uncharacterized protein LOC126808653 [Patella vulgata]
MATVTETEVLKTDDDILSMVRQTFGEKTKEKEKVTDKEGEIKADERETETEESGEKSFIDTVCQLLQAERNHWKERVQNSLQEINKQHRTVLATRASLQELVNSVYPPSNRPGSVESKQQNASDLITKLRFYIRDTKSAKDRVARDNILQSEVVILKEDLSRINLEKEDHLQTISNLNKEILWLQRELVSVKQKLEQVRKIVKNYNEARSSSFHLDDVVPQDVEIKDGDHDCEQFQINITRERTYHEGDQTLPDTTPREAFSIMKLRERQMTNISKQSNDVSTMKRTFKMGIGKCLRCQKLFRSSENNNMACRFHRKGREITECYNNHGKLLRVVYKWACCKKPLDTSGCNHGYHI